MAPRLLRPVMVRRTGRQMHERLKENARQTTLWDASQDRGGFVPP